MHDRHAAAGAEFMWAGDWRRPHHYTTPEEEVDAVRNRVGVIDVSTLGKFRIKGPQAVELLERLYPNRFSDLAVGRVRYGAMLNDEGVILDDGADRSARRRRVLRDRDHRQHGCSGALDHLVERRLGPRCARAERHRRVRSGEPRRPSRTRHHGFADRRRRLGRSDAVHDLDEDGRRGRAVAGPPDRLRGGDGLRDPFPVGVRGARVGCPDGGRRSRRDRRVRPRGPADPPSGEAAHPRRAGHRRRVGSVRGRARVDGEGGQAGLPRPARAPGPRATQGRGNASSGSRPRMAGCRRRARRSCGTARGSVG